MPPPTPRLNPHPPPQSPPTAPFPPCVQDKPTKEYEVSAATKEKSEEIAEKMARREAAKKGKKVVKKKM